MKYLCCMIVGLLCLDYYATEGQNPFKKICHDGLEISFFASLKKFAAAKQACVDYGGHLVKVESKEIQQAIESALGKPDGQRYYIGGKQESNGNFMWVADRTKVGESGWTNWRPGQPNHIDDEDCLGLGIHKEYRWSDVACTHAGSESRYICQKKGNPFTITTFCKDNNCTCQSLTPGVLLNWLRDSMPVTKNENTGVYQINSTSESVLTSLNITDAGTYTCVGEARCVTQKKDKTVTVDGTPTIRKIENNKCNASLFVTWKPNKAAVGFPHRFSTTGSTKSLPSFFVTPESTKVRRTEIPLSAVTYRYHVTITACLSKESCDTSFEATTSNKTDGITDPVTSVILQSARGKGCQATWLSPAKDAAFMILTHCTVDKSRGDKGNGTINKVVYFMENKFEFQPSPNRRCKISIQAKGCGNISQSVKSDGACVTPPKEPDSITAPKVKHINKDSMAITFTKPSEDNGLISCIFIILCYGKCASAEFTIDDLVTANNSGKNNNAKERNEIAIAVPIANISQTSKTYELSKGNITNCNVYDTGYPGSSQEVSNLTFQGRNMLNKSVEYIGAFVVTTTPSDNGILLKSSVAVTVAKKIELTTSAPTATITTGTRTPLHGWVIGMIAGISVLLIIAVVTVLVIRKKRGALRKPPEDQPNVQYIAQENEAAQIGQNPAPGVQPANHQELQANNGRVEEVNPYINEPPQNLSEGTENRITDLEAVYNSMRKNGNAAFSRQYNGVLQEAAKITKPTTAASTFMKKNRYKNILPFDDCRVPLAGSEAGYINASYINGFRSAKKYIATQGPLKATVADFWMMAMEQNSHVIVMLTKEYDAGKKKCEKYWPDLGKSLNFSNGITVESRQETSCNAYIERILVIRNKNDGSTLVIYQYQFMKWPDHGVPQTTSNLIRMHRIVTNKINELQSQSPIIVHCSAGAGRTGAFVAYDYLLKEAEETGKVDVYRCVVGMRNQRIQMVQNADQYTLVYKLLVEAHIFVDYDYATDELKSRVANLESRDGSRELEREFRELGRMEPMKNSRSVGTEKRYKKFNRGQDAVPYDYSLVSVIMTSEETEPPYINASFIESYDSSTKMIATQGPFDNTIEIFWRVVLDRAVTTIVMLNPLKEGKEEQCARYWPGKVGELGRWGDVSVVCPKDRSLGECVSERTFEITRGTETKTVTQFHLTGWKENSCPDDPSEILDVINKMQKHYRSTGEGGTVLIHCNDGIGRTGAFCTIVNLIDRVKWENRIDVFRTVKDLRDGRPNMVKTVDQYQFCYKAIATYLKSFELYANF